MGGIFISYRRIDSKVYAGRLFDRLSRNFGRRTVFMDVEGGIARGEDFAQALEGAVNSVDAMVVVIGRQWLACTDDQGRHRLDIPADWVRGEVAAALARKIRLLPVLVDGAGMPREGDLPANITALARKQASEISDTRWDYDVGQIMKVLEQVVPPQSEPDDHPSPWPGRRKKLLRWIGWTVVGTAVLIAVAIINAVMTDPRNYDCSADPPQIRFEWDRKSVDAKAINVTVTNTGKSRATFRIDADYWTGKAPSPGVVTIKDNSTCDKNVAVGATCTAKVVFDPQWFNGDERDRQFNGSLSIKVPNKGGCSLIPLSIRYAFP